jgi:hypothetical protein
VKHKNRLSALFSQVYVMKKVYLFYDSSAVSTRSALKSVFNGIYLEAQAVASNWWKGAKMEREKESSTFSLTENFPDS